MINRKNYPELDLLLWDMHSLEIEEKTALNIYERRWRYVDQTKISDHEQLLIDTLVAKHGNGIFFPS